MEDDLTTMGLVLLIGRILLGVALAIFAVSLFRDPQLANAMLAILCAAIAGFCLYPLLTHLAGSTAGNLMYSGKAEEPRESYSSVHAKLRAHEFEAAAEELRERLVEKPDLDGTVLLGRILYDHLKRPAEALAVAQAELQPQRWQPQHTPLTRLAVDALLDLGRPAEAGALLERVLPAVRDPAVARELRERRQTLPAS